MAWGEPIGSGRIVRALRLGRELGEARFDGRERCAFPIGDWDVGPKDGANAS